MENEKKIIAYKGFDKDNWVDIKGYEGLYKVSNKGLVFSLARKVCSGRSYGVRGIGGTLLNQRVDKDGYLCVSLCKNGKKRTHRVHRLVATAFLNNPQNYNIVNHLDECKANNYVGNLEWCTVDYNNHYGKGYKRNYKRKVVAMLSTDMKIIGTFDSISKAASFVKGNRNTISKHCCNKSTRLYKGYLWRFNFKEVEE